MVTLYYAVVIAFLRLPFYVPNIFLGMPKKLPKCLHKLKNCTIYYFI